MTAKPFAEEGFVRAPGKARGMEVQRTLVKSPPELWAALSDPGALAEHLGEFGEIRITRTEPETTVAWEGELASGTVALEASGWGTKVTLAAEPALVAPTVESPAVRTETPTPATSAPSRGLLARLLRRGPRAETPAPPTPGPSPTPGPDPAPPSPAPAPGPGPQIRVEHVLERVLDDLGTDSRRPFAR